MTAPDQTATTLSPGLYTFTSAGGTDVGALTANYTLAPWFMWTNKPGNATVSRARGITVNWSGGPSSGYVLITGSSYGTAIGSFSCTARISDTSFTVPRLVLLGLPPSGPSGAVSSGSLTVSAFDFQTFPPPTGIDVGLVGSVISYSSSVTYQ